MSDFIIDMRRILAPGTVERYARALTMFRRMLNDRGRGDIPVSALSIDLLRTQWEWLRDPRTGLHGQQRTEDTARKNLEVVQLFWRWLFNNDTENQVPPVRVLDMPRSIPGATVAPKREEMDRCIAACTTTWHRQLTTIMRFTGLRVAQVMMLEWAHVDLKRATLRVTTGKSAQEKRGRVVPISRHLVAELKSWGPRDGYIVESGRRGERSRQPRARDIGRAWKRAQVRSEAWDGRPDHAFRKGFVSGLKRAGADADAVEFLVGHSLGLRGIYTDADALPLVKVIKLIPKRQKKFSGPQEDQRAAEK